MRRSNTSEKISLVMAPRTFLEWFEVGAPGGPRKLSLFDVCGWVWRYKRVSMDRYETNETRAQELDGIPGEEIKLYR